ncbi:MAG: hypothetical protein ACR2HO_07230 [Rubrobacteraceae bacterium]
MAQDGEEGGICHVPTGNPENVRFISAADPSFDSHVEEHEGDFPVDSEEECVPPGGDDVDGAEDATNDQYSDDVADSDKGVIPITIPGKKLPPTGGFPPALSLGALLVAGGLIGAGIVRRR